MKRVLLPLAALLLALPAAARAQAAAEPAAQEPPAREAETRSTSRNAVFVEFLGNAGLYSLNVERKLGDHFSIRLGAMHSEDDQVYGSGATNLKAYPLLFNYLAGSGSSRLEIGFGFLTGEKTHQDGDVIGTGGFMDLTGTLGYRYQARRSGLLFRAGLTPFYSPERPGFPDESVSLSAGVSIGFTF